MSNDVKRYWVATKARLNRAWVSIQGIVVAAEDYDSLIDRYEANTAIMHARTEALGRVTAERDALAAELQALKAARAEPVAWMHDQPGRVDVIHDVVKGLLADAHAAGVSPGQLHRPLDRTEHYTIPLYAAPPAAQDVSALPPFAEKVLAKLRRFEECAEDSDSGGVDIGRHWLDLLTQLALLNRVQRSPGLWEISQQGEDFLAAHRQAQQQADQPPPASTPRQT